MPASKILYQGAVYHLAFQDMEKKIEAVLPMVDEYLQASGVGTGNPEDDEPTARAMANILVHAVMHSKIFDEAPTEHTKFDKWLEANYPASAVGAGVHDIVMYLSMYDHNLFDRAVEVIRSAGKGREHKRGVEKTDQVAEAITYLGSVYRLAVQGQELNPRQLADQILVQADQSYQLFVQKLQVAKQALTNAVSSEEGETAKERLSNMLDDSIATYNHVWRLLDSMENFGTSKSSVPAQPEKKEEPEEE